MQALDNAIILILIALSFYAGMKVDQRYRREAYLDQKDALSRQYLRLRAHMDADDPVQPYMAPRANCVAAQTGFQTPEEFNEKFNKNGQAVMKFRKSDLVK